jgi:hypothetical protein
MAEDGRPNDVLLDFTRPARIGLEEAVLAEGKSAAQLAAILDRAAAEHTSLLLTRFADEALAGLPEHHQRRLDYDPVSRTGFFARAAPDQPPVRVGIVSAGTSDVGVAEEARRTLLYAGIGALAAYDVGVAGLWRLLRRVEELRRLPVVIAVAGMDAALPSVLGGLVPGLVIAVPTSTGYGVARDGETALRAALASCAPGLVVTNVDNGYGAATAALRVLNAKVPD